MTKWFKIWFAFCIVMIPFAIAIQASVWNECQVDGHSFFYCSALISGK